MRICFDFDRPAAAALARQCFDLGTPVTVETPDQLISGRLAGIDPTRLYVDVGASWGWVDIRWDVIVAIDGVFAPDDLLPSR